DARGRLRPGEVNGATTSGVLAAALFAATGLSGWRLWFPRRAAETDYYLDSRESDAAHLLMNGSMGVMLTPAWTPSTAGVVLALYAFAGLVFGARLVILALNDNSAAPAADGRFGATLYHAAALAALALAVAKMAPDALGGICGAVNRLP